MEGIVNKVKESGLISMDLADYKPKILVQEIDLKNQLWQGLVLKEKDFRSWIKEHDWSIYKNTGVYIHCSADAIVPTWAYMLVASNLNGYANCYIVGNNEDLTKKIIKTNIDAIILDEFTDGRIIIKGCSDIPYPDYAMVCMVEKLQASAKSIMYGEPCSAVPVFKRK